MNVTRFLCVRTADSKDAQINTFVGELLNIYWFLYFIIDRLSYFLNDTNKCFVKNVNWLYYCLLFLQEDYVYPTITMYQFIWTLDIILIDKISTFLLLGLQYFSITVICNMIKIRFNNVMFENTDNL